MWKKAAIVVIMACAISVWFQTPSNDYHTVLVSLGRRFPIMQTLGEYFHVTESTTEKLSPTKVLKKHDWMSGPRKHSTMRMLNDDDIELKKGGPLFLVIVGHVFDVSEGANYYNADSAYFGFIGRDASRAFVTGQFDKEGLISDLDGLANSEYKGLSTWIKFYLDHEQYKHVGYYIGRYFNEKGEETEYMKQFRGWVQAALKEEDEEEDMKKQFPPCNVEWTAELGTKFSCSTLSGGISREWVGVPRQFYQEGNNVSRCSCVHPNRLADPRVKKYPNCNDKATECRVPK